jgi:hypothetical protein
VLTIVESHFLSGPFFPVKSGLFWTYQVNGFSFTTTVLPGTVNINGVAAKAFQDESGFTNYFTNDIDGIRFHRQFVPDLFIEGLGVVDVTVTFSPPVKLANAVADIGQTVNSSGTAFALASTGETANVGYSASYTVQGFESITVPKGTFTALRIQGTLNIDGDIVSQTMYLVRNIGIAKLIESDGVSTVTTELIETNANIERLGIYRNGFWFVDLNGNGQWDGCGTDGCQAFGIPTDVPVVGDWTGTGEAKRGVYRNGFWFLDLNGNGEWDGCAVDACIAFGIATDVPVVGDWTGTGEMKIGVRRDGMWFLDWNGNGQWDGCGVDACIAFGTPTDVPVVGDWTGTGEAKIGVRRDGMWFLDWNGNRQWDGCEVDGCQAFGIPTDVPVVGDW